MKYLENKTFEKKNVSYKNCGASTNVSNGNFIWSASSSGGVLKVNFKILNENPNFLFNILVVYSIF